MAIKKNGAHLTDTALESDDARIPAPKKGDKLLDVRLACEGYFDRHGIRHGGMRQAIHAAAKAGAAKKKGGAK